jgi:hypothetical protein
MLANSPSLRRLFRLGVETLIGLLALLTADSIYNEPRRLRMALLGVAAAALLAGVVRIFLLRKSGTLPRAIGGSWLAHRALLGGLLAAFFAGSAMVRPGLMGRELHHILLPWREFRTPAEIAEQQRLDQREAETHDLLDTARNEHRPPP